jgi:isoleucyl-tRNA synthetase
MHKSAGNAIDPLEVIGRYGADVLRLWVASEDPTADMTVSDALFKAVAENYRRLRNTLRWLLGALDGFQPSGDAVPLERLEPVDRWLLARTAVLVEEVTAAMEAWQLHKAFAAILAFCAHELSALAFDIHKDTLYTLARRDPRRRSAQTAFHEVLQVLLRLISPVLVFTAEEAWEHLPPVLRDASSVHFSTWPAAHPQWRDAELEEDFRLLFEVLRPAVTKPIEALRAAKTLGHSYDAEVTLKIHSKRLLRVINKYAAALPSLLIVSAVHVGHAAPRDGLTLTPEEVTVTPSRARKCARCWRRPGDVQEQGGICGRCREALAG